MVSLASRAMPDDKHSTLSGYIYWRCRCDLCRAASNAYKRDRYRQQTGSTGFPAEEEVPHGTRNKYRRGCRCEDCVQALRAHAREQYRKADPEEERARRQAWAAANAEKVSQYGAEWYAARREEEQLRRRLAYAADPEPYKTRARARQLRVRGVQVEEVCRSVVWDRDGGICHICHEPADPDDWHLDHIVAIHLGGEHSYANTAVSHPRCNLEKGRKPWSP